MELDTLQRFETKEVLCDRKQVDLTSSVILEEITHTNLQSYFP